MDQKTSLLINSQLPEFIREEYPQFISFLEAYYQFLEKEQIVNGTSQQNDLTTKLKQLRYVSDIDQSLSQFEEQFYNEFLPLLPKDTKVDKAFLIKNILPLYQAKGTEKSFYFLFRLLFGEEITISYPRNQILRTSDGKWSIENILRTDAELYSEYVSNGVQKTYYLPYDLDEDAIQVYINGSLMEHQVNIGSSIVYNYIVRKELRKIIFYTAPTVNSKIKIVYPTQFNVAIFKNRKITGLTSGAYALVENMGIRNVAGSNFFEFFINQKTIVGNFINGEMVKVDYINPENHLITFYLQALSDVESVQIIQPGSNYQVGDVVNFLGASKTKAVAVVGSVSTGNVQSLTVKVGSFGSGYKIGNNVYPSNINTASFIASIDAVDDSGAVSSNTITYNNTDYISNLSNVVLSSSDYGFVANGTQNLTSIIGNSLTLSTVTNLGPAINVIVSFSELTNNTSPIFVANSTVLYSNVTISDLGAIGTIKVNNGGTGYLPGDSLIFTNTEYFSGQGAAAKVSSVSSNGSIRRVQVTNSGRNYRKDYLPTITVNSISGANANLAIQDFMGEGAEFQFEAGDGIAGKVLSINLLNKGTGYSTKPVGDLSQSGDGEATTNVIIRPSVIELPGRWLTSDSLLSSDDVKLEGKNYYIDFSYVISSKVEFSKYKNIIKELLNPSGAVNYAIYKIIETIDLPITINIESELTRQVSGTVNVAANSYFVTGYQNTHFVVANNTSLLMPGTHIKVNGEIRIANSIINNTSITVSEPFTYSAIDQLITIMIPPYTSITTEYWREVQTEANVNNFLITEANVSPSII
jgi:hypothetical protein